jgi:hypothetical protein
MPGGVVMRMPVSVVRHMMPMGVVCGVMSMMYSGRGRRGEHQRGRNDDRQSRDDFTHERLRKEHFQQDTISMPSRTNLLIRCNVAVMIQAAF